jgi:hypothetical protein
MRKIFTLLAIMAVCLISCSKGDEPEPEQNQPTTFTFTTHEDVDFPNCVAGYYGTDGICHKLGDLGNMTKDVVSPEITVPGDSITKVYFFTDYMRHQDVENPNVFWVTKTDTVFVLKQHTTNAFVLTPDMKGTYVKQTDPAQYPH